MKSILSKVSGLWVVLILVLMVRCSSPLSEEFQLVDQLYLAVLPFTMEGKYVAYELRSTTQDTQFIEKLKKVHDIPALELLKEKGYILIENIEQFDNLYKKDEQLYFIVVKIFINEDGSLKYIYVNNFNENNF
ncbi:hypothetical protein QYZ87_02705 [Porphyromonadaceae bacterium W3.11]|nr:hypothetical protein [Porphyromonadaceae bacterium W3.11]